jgi:hypothetical protein
MKRAHRVALVALLMAGAGCHRRRSERPATPCAQAAKLVRGARRAAAVGLLDRAVGRLDAAERLCPSLRDTDAAARADWIIEGRMARSAARWVARSAGLSDAAEASRAERGAADTRPAQAWADDARSAELCGELRAARVLYTRAFDAFDRAGATWSSTGLPSHASKRVPRGFSPRNGWFLEETALDGAASRLTAWSPDGSRPYTLQVDGSSLDAAITPLGLVLYRGPKVVEWAPRIGTSRTLGWAGPARSARFPVESSGDGTVVAWGNFAHRAGGGLALLDDDPVSVALSPDGRRLVSVAQPAFRASLAAAGRHVRVAAHEYA